MAAFTRPLIRLAPRMAAVIGRNASPVSSGDIRCWAWKSRLNRKISP